MASTEALVRAQVVTAIQAIATTAEGSGGLGMDSTDAVKDYLFEYHPPHDWESYLLNDVSSAPQLRAFGVMVTSSYPESYFNDVNGESRRLYTVTIELYDVFGATGAGVNRVVDNGRRILKAIKDHGVSLGNTVFGLDNPDVPAPAVTDAPDDYEETEMLIGEIIITSEMQPVTW